MEMRYGRGHGEGFRGRMCPACMEQSIHEKELLKINLENRKGPYFREPEVTG